MTIGDTIRSWLTEVVHDVVHLDDPWTGKQTNGGQPQEPVAAGALGGDGREKWVASPAAERRLGATVHPIKDDEVGPAHLSAKVGLVVDKVAPGGPAAKADIKPGDIITELDAQPLFVDRDIPKAAEREGKKPGDTVDLWVRRNDGNQTIKLTLGDLEPPAPAAPPIDPKPPAAPAGPASDWQGLITQASRVSSPSADRDVAISALRGWEQTHSNDKSGLPPMAAFAAGKLFDAIRNGDMGTALAIKDGNPWLAKYLPPMTSAPSAGSSGLRPQKQAPVPSAVVEKPAASPPPAPLDIGVKLAAISPEVAAKLAPSDRKTDDELENPFRDRLLKGMGAIVDAAPEPNSIAAKIGKDVGGLQFGDLIIKVNGAPILSPPEAADQIRALNDLKPGLGAYVAIWRNGAEKHLFFRQDEPIA